MTSEQLASRFHSRFRGLERAYGTYLIQGNEGLKLKGQAKTLVGKITDTLWLSHLEGIQSLGVTPINDEAQCVWGAIDIDVYDGFDHAALERKVNEEKLPLVLCRTKSGGAHAFLFTKEPTDAELIRDRLGQWAYLLGYPAVEIFPKQIKLASQDDVGSWLNMPYFSIDDTSRYCIKDGKQISAEEFLDYAETKAVSSKYLEEFAVEVDALLEGAPPCLAYLCKFGIPPGGRNNGMFQMAIYAKKRWGESDWEEKAREMATKFLHPALSSRELKTIIGSVAKKDYQYKCSDAPMKKVCNKSTCYKAEFGVGLNEEDPGVDFKDLTKLNTRPPIWFVTINDKRVRIDNTLDLSSQERCRVLCINEVNALMRRVKSEYWDKLLQELLKNVEVVEVPEEADLDGTFRDLMDSFCTDSPRGTEVGDLLNGAVFKDETYWYFRARDLLKFLQVHRFQDTAPNVTWARLKSMGGLANKESINGKSVKFWTLPGSVFEDHDDVPEPRVEKNAF